MIRQILLAALCVASVAAEELPPDVTVASDGSGQFKSVHDAVQSIPKDNRERVVIFIKDGIYNEKIRIDAACITLRGQSRAGTRIEFAQLNDDFVKKPDDRGRAVINIESKADDLVLENLTVVNTAGVVGPHSFAIYGKADRTVIVDCDVLSEGADTVSLWKGDTGRYYHARCNFRGAVDFVCPRGWCYVVDCTFFETKATAAMWHDGSKNQDQKFVLRNCKFDGVEGWVLARHHRDAQFYFIDCTFSQTMADKPPQRVIYPLSTAPATQGDLDRNRELDKENRWGERSYFHNCRREGAPDFPWHQDNLTTAAGAPRAEQITADWTFAGTWNPETSQGPQIIRVEQSFGKYSVKFDEPVTVRGQPQARLSDGKSAAYDGGSGTDTLRFTILSAHQGKLAALDLDGGRIIASQAAAAIRPASLEIPPQPE